MTCKDAINLDISSDDKKVYLLNEIRKCNKDFKFNLEGTTDQNCKNNRIILSNSTKLIQSLIKFFQSIFIS